MGATTTAITAKDITWETSDGQTYGNHEASECYIEITCRIPRSMWTTGTNERDWAVYNDNHSGPIASGHADGLRNAKRAALQALNDHLAGGAEPAELDGHPTT